MSVTPLSPQNVPYLVLENMRFESDLLQWKWIWGEGFPSMDALPTIPMNVQRRLNSSIRTPVSKDIQVSIAENMDTFNSSTPYLRSDLTVRLQGNDTLLPTVDIPIRLEEAMTMASDWTLNSVLWMSQLSFGRIVNPEIFAYADRSTIRFESTELTDTIGQYLC